MGNIQVNGYRLLGARREKARRTFSARTAMTKEHDLCNARQSCFRFHRSEVDAYANDADQAIRTSPLRPSKAATIRIGPVA
jgi:hypothetical protein